MVVGSNLSRIKSKSTIRKLDTAMSGPQQITEVLAETARGDLVSESRDNTVESLISTHVNGYLTVFDKD